MRYIKTFEQFVNESKVNEEYDPEGILSELDKPISKKEVINLYSGNYKDYTESDAKKDGAGWIDPKKLYDKVKTLPNNIYTFSDGDGAYDLYEFIDKENGFKFKQLEIIQVGPYTKGYQMGVDGNYDELLKKGKKARNLGYGDFFILSKVSGNGITLYMIEADVSFGDRSTPEIYEYYIDDKNLKKLNDYLKTEADKE